MPCHAHGKQAGTPLNRLKDACTNPHLYISLLFLSVLQFYDVLALISYPSAYEYIHTHTYTCMKDPV